MNSKSLKPINTQNKDYDYDDLPPLVALEIPKQQKQFSSSQEKSLFIPVPVPFISEQSHISVQQSQNTLRPDSPQLQRMVSDSPTKEENKPIHIQPIVLDSQKNSKNDQKYEAIQKQRQLRRNQTMLTETIDKEKNDSEKFVEGFLKIAKIDLSIFDINNLKQTNLNNQNDKLMEPIVQDKLMTQAKIFRLKQEQHILTNKSESRFKNLETQVELLEEKILHLDQILNLNKDKVSLKRQLNNLKRVLDHLSKQFIRIQQEFKDQLQRLTSFILNLPSEKEKALEMQILNLNKELDEERKQKELLESSYGNNLVSVQQLISEAFEAKKQLLDQVQSLKKKNENLDDYILKYQQDHNFQIQTDINQQNVSIQNQHYLYNNNFNNSQNSSIKQAHVLTSTTKSKSQRKINENPSIQNSQFQMSKIEIQE